MSWRDPKVELPEEGAVVWVLTQHNKQHKPLSCEMYCGKVEYSKDETSCRVQTDDFTGKGAWAIYFKGGTDFDDVAIAWMYATQMPLPAWVPHDPWWK